MKVKLLFPLAGPGIGGHEAGTVLDLPDAMAKELLKTGQVISPEEGVKQAGPVDGDFEPVDPKDLKAGKK